MLQLVLFTALDLPLDPAVHAMDCDCASCGPALAAWAEWEAEHEAELERVEHIADMARWEAEILDWELGVMARIEAEVEASLNR